MTLANDIEDGALRQDVHFDAAVFLPEVLPDAEPVAFPEHGSWNTATPPGASTDSACSGSLQITCPHAIGLKRGMRPIAAMTWATRDGIDAAPSTRTTGHCWRPSDAS